MGLELAEQLDWELPDAIIYPTGGGTGIVGMWKAFDEMEALGWIGPRAPEDDRRAGGGLRPHRARLRRAASATPSSGRTPTPSPAGMRVPVAIGDYLILDAIRESGGTALTVSDAALLADMATVARTEGVSAAPEGAATVAALRLLLDRGFLGRDERIVLFNTGAAWKYAETLPPADVPLLDPRDARVQERIA